MKPLMLFMCIGMLAPPAWAQMGAGAATPVVVTVAQKGDFADEIEALGTLRANESVDLTAAVTEIVTKISFDDNQRVQRGDILIEMDAAEELAELAEQQSFVKEARRQLERLAPLVKKRAASPAALDEQRRELETAQARVKAIQSRIDQRIIKAPFDGILGLRNISVGSLAQPGVMITTIDDDSEMKLDFSVPEVFLSTLKPGVGIKATTEAYQDTLFEGTILYVDSRIDPVTRSIQARALLDNTEGLLKPGLLMQVELQKDPRKALLIPEESLISDGPDSFVFVVREQEGKATAERRKVKLGTRHYGEAEILEGLSEGEQIITQGTLRVREGAPLQILAVQEKGDSLKELLKENMKASDE